MNTGEDERNLRVYRGRLRKYAFFFSFYCGFECVNTQLIVEEPKKKKKAYGF